MWFLGEKLYQHRRDPESSELIIMQFSGLTVPTTSV